MESSQFTSQQSRFESIEQLDTQGATCDTFRVKLYGKLHFLKRLRPEYVGDIRYQEALRKEFETGYQLEHPNLVRYISLDADSILMEYVDGETLTQRLATHPDYFKNRKNADRFVRQLLDAISYLHSHQVLHLDLKPDNILLTHIDDDVKLIDLGFCRSDAFVDTQGYTSGFAAPEQFAGGMVDARTDIYAVGKILERLPDHRIYNKVIARCTAIEPAERYQSIEEIRSDINRRQHYSRYVAAIVAIVAIVGVGIALLTHREQTAPVIQETPVDSVVQMQDQGDRSLDSVQEHGPVPSIPSLDSVRQNPAQVPVNPPLPPKKDEQTLMKEEVERLIDKAYRSTIASFCDSVWPPLVNYPGNPWADSSTEFHNQVVEIGNRLVKKYPNIPEGVIRQETEMHFQGLVGYTFNKMRENGQP